MSLGLQVLFHHQVPRSLLSSLILIEFLNAYEKNIQKQLTGHKCPVINLYNSNANNKFAKNHSSPDVYRNRHHLSQQYAALNVP